MRKRVNRVLLFLIGLVLLVVGAVVLIGGLDLPRRWDFTLPSWWPYSRPHDVLLSAHNRTRYRADGWWWPVVIAVLAVVVVIAVWWLLAQFRTRRLGQVVVEGGEDGGVLVRGRALQEALAAETAALPGVADAGVMLTGRRTTPAARMVLRVGATCVPWALVRDIDAKVLAEARGSTGIVRLPAEVRMRAEHRRTRRVG